jgi:hypothetical protein
VLGLILVPAAAVASVTVTLNPSVPSPELLGTNITWTAAIQGGVQGHTYDFQFSAALQGQTQIVRDFDLPSRFTWVPWSVEGNYVVTVVARDVTAQPFIVFPPVSVQYVIDPIVTTQGVSEINRTNHPLVALFSAGPCTPGHSIRVRFRANGTLPTTPAMTNAIPCSTKSSNYLVAGMAPVTPYVMQWEEFGPGFDQFGPNQPFTTGAIASSFSKPKMTLNVPPSLRDASFPVVLFQALPQPGTIFSFWPMATDLQGNVIWYNAGVLLITRMEPGGNYFSMSNTLLTERDLAGNITLQTNASILNEQLVAKGYPTMDSFNIHETRRLPNGNMLLLASRDEVSTSEQGGTQQNPVDIIGDMVLILDHNMQLVWAWDSFAHEDLSREATLNDLCFQNLPGCPPFNPQFAQANDWLHSNAAQMMNDGNILVSQRDQDWVIKINYQNGQGDGRVLWRMGPGGDFTISNPPQQTCGDPAVYPWFTHQHDAAFQTQGIALDVFTVFDDGNTRHQQCGGGNSRGQVYYVQESTRTVFIETSADLGAYSIALGSAQLLVSPPNNTFASFGNGFISDPQGAQVSETDLSGHIVYQLQMNGANYRIYRQSNLYTPTLP